MDRSLKFFLNTPNKQIKTDNTTGLPVNSQSVQYNINTYKADDPFSNGKSETKTANYTVTQSLQTDSQYINYLGNATTNDYNPHISDPNFESDISLSNIINWTQKNMPAMKLNAFNFAYLKEFNVYPANRLMILRRFPDAVPNDLFNTKVSPLHTMVTYYDFEKSPIDISFNEKWKTFNKSFMDVLEDVIGIKFSNIPGVNNVISVATGSNLSQEIFTKIGQALGIVSAGDIPYGDPNIIYESTIRDVDGEDFSSGLESDIKIKFETTYLFQEINGVDGKAAMLDIISNAIHMGTSDSRFYITGVAANKLNELMTEMENGNTTGLFTKITSSLKEILDTAINKIKVVAIKAKAAAVQHKDGENPAFAALGAVLDQLTSFSSTLLKARYSRYKWPLKGAVSALSGLPTAPWHITIGNPKYPWFCIGNLVVDSVSLEAGGELSYNDMFTELTVKIDLKSGRSLGANELGELFNMGKGRIYDTPANIQSVSVPDNAQLKLPGNTTTDTNQTQIKPNSTNQIQDQDKSQTEVDQTNYISNVSPFSSGQEDINDPNLGGINKNNYTTIV